MRVRTTLLVASFAITYFLGLTYAILMAGTYFGLQYFAFLVLAAVVFGIFAARHKTRLGVAFLIFLNVSRIFFLGIGATLLLNGFGIIKVPLSNVNFLVSWPLSFGVYAVLNFVYVFGFSDRKQKYVFFSWVRESSSSEIHRF